MNDQNKQPNSVLLLVSIKIGKYCNFFLFVCLFNFVGAHKLVYLFLIFVTVILFFVFFFGEKGILLCQLCSKYLPS